MGVVNDVRYLDKAVVLPCQSKQRMTSVGLRFSSKQSLGFFFASPCTFASQAAHKYKHLFTRHIWPSNGQHHQLPMVRNLDLLAVEINPYLQLPVVALPVVVGRAAALHLADSPYAPLGAPDDSISETPEWQQVL